MKLIRSIWLIAAWLCLYSINTHGSLPALPTLPTITTTTSTTKPTTTALPTLPSTTTTTTTPSTTTSTLPTLPSLSTTTTTTTPTTTTTTKSAAPIKTGSQSSAASTSVSETMMPIIHIQNNCEDEGTLNKISIQISDTKTKKSVEVTGKVTVKLPAKPKGKISGPVIAFNPSISNSPFSPEFNGVKAITIDSSTITFPKMFSGLSAIHAITVTKENGKWVLDKTVHKEDKKSTSTTKNKISQSANSRSL